MDRIPEYRPYLIARCQTCNDPDADRMRSLYSYDYMGSAEFEFGAIPGSLARMRISIIDARADNTDALLIVEIPDTVAKLGAYAGKKLHALVPKQKYEREDWRADFHAGVASLVDDSARLKEWSALNYHFKESRFGSSLTYDLWHDIKNDIFFAFSYELLALIASQLHRDIKLAKPNDVRQWFKGGDTVMFVNPRKGLRHDNVNHTVERWQLREGKIVSIDDDVVTIASKGDRFRVGWNMLITCPEEALGKKTDDLIEASRRR